jgi:hypothetical protein
MASCGYRNVICLGSLIRNIATVPVPGFIITYIMFKIRRRKERNQIVANAADLIESGSETLGKSIF